jgi:hypothetical protein
MPKTSRRLTVHPLTLREVEVAKVTDLTPGMRRITLAGERLGAFTSANGFPQPGFESTGFDDDIRLVFCYQETYKEIIADTRFVNVDRWESSDPGTFSISDFGCVEIAQGDLGMDFPKAAEGEDPLGWTSLPFEQIAGLSKYDVITYPVDAEGNPKAPFEPVVETNTWKALPAVKSGRALGLFCPGNNSYGPVLQYLDSLDRALASLPKE